MSKFYLDLPYTSEVPQAYQYSSAELMEVSGLNIGNYAFRHALRFILSDLDSYTPVRYPEYGDAARNDKVEQTIVSCANWLGTSDQDEASNLNRVRAFEASEGPVVCFGLGVQAPASGEIPELRPNTRRLAEVLASKAALLSVRDDLTAQTLEEIGIRNTVVTGCPSNFINPDPELGQRIIERVNDLRRREPEWSEMRSVLSEFSGGHAASGGILKESLRLLAETPSFLVLQSPTLLPFLLREHDDLPHVYLSNNPFDEGVGRLRRVLRSSTLHFSSIESWLDFSRTCHLAFGMRIHGTMIPLQAGVPSILISHDSRTQGLASRMGIPVVPAETFNEIRKDGPGRMLNQIASQMVGYDETRSSLARVMFDYVVQNNLKPHPGLQHVASNAEM